MARPKTQKIQTPASTDLSKVGIAPLTKQIIQRMEEQIEPAPPKRGDIIQVVPHDKEARHPLMANIMIVHELLLDNQEKLVCYQPGKGGHPAKRMVDAVDALVVGHARLKIAEGKQLPEAERPRYDDPLDKI